MNLTKQEMNVLSELGKTYAEIASLPIQKEKEELWRSLNRLKMERPMVVIDQIPWNEMDVDGSLVNQVKDPYWQGVESSLRQQIYQFKHMPADMVVNPCIMLPRLISHSGFGVAVDEEISVGDKTNGVVGHKFNNQFQEMEDVERIKEPKIDLDRAGEAVVLQQASEIFGGIAPVKLCASQTHLGIWDTITMWMGVEACYIELMDRPELIHAIMKRFTEVKISEIEQLNALKVFDTYSNKCHCTYTYLDDLPGADCDRENATSKDAWAFGLAQLFSSVSPDITDEFEVPYMQKLFPYFGAIYYGCCDRLDDRLDIVAKMPNIRKVSCSPWSKREEFAQKLPKEYIMSNKPTPALLAVDTMDYEAVRADVRRTIDAAKAGGVGLELIIKDISTVKYEPQRLWEWSKVVLEEVSR